MTSAQFIRLIAAGWLLLSAFGFAFFKGDSWFGLQIGLGLWAGSDPLGILLGGILKGVLAQLPKPTA